jgi:cell division protein FtsL
MKKGSKPFLFFSVLLFTTFIVLSLFYVGIKLKCEELTKEKILSEQQLDLKKNWQVDLTVKYQFLTSEERIIEIAEKELGMIRGGPSILKIEISKQKTETIENRLREKYE